MIDAETLGKLLPEYLPRQRWFGGSHRQLEGAEVVAFELLREDWPALAWALADAHFEDGSSATYQVVVGLRPLESTDRFLQGKGRFLLGDVDTADGPALAYDALVDPELALAVLAQVHPGEPARLVRPLNVEQSNTSIVYDERLILKLFRRVYDGPNPDVEVTRALASAGFEQISAPVAEWRRDGTDLAVLRTYLVGATDGLHLAHTSLRDLYDSRLPPGQSGGDFAPEAGRLGQITATMHVALAQAFGVGAGEGEVWADAMTAHLARVQSDRLDRPRIAAAFDRVREVRDTGAAIRVHGDLHLGQTMRADAGWFVLDFEGEPERPVSERRHPSSPLRDVAGMNRSFHYATRTALAERGEDVDDELLDLARAWEDRAVAAFLDGYLGVDEVAPLLPDGREARDALLTAFELDKAVYEVGYELANRPDWVGIPAEAVERLLATVP